MVGFVACLRLAGLNQNIEVSGAIPVSRRSTRGNSASRVCTIVTGPGVTSN